MFGIASVVAFAVALILQLASVSKGVFLTAPAFVIIGLLLLAAHLTIPWGHRT
jgi:formate-dependent nitrite reductase membrane component NrfD